MKIGKKFLVIVLALALVPTALCLNGCKKSEPEGNKTNITIPTDAELCKHCGHIKGSDLCCKPDQPKCSECGLAKGSPGCCKMPEKI